MALSATLTDLPLADLLHLLATNQLSGRLTLTNKEGQAMVVFRDGKIIYAATNGARETFGSMLVHRKVITPSTLTEALKLQAESSEERRLGSILLELGAVDEAVLESVMHEQVGRVLSHLLQWRQGFVRFEQLQIPQHGEIGVDAHDFVLREGLATDRVMFEVMSQLSAADDGEDELLLDALAGGHRAGPASGGATRDLGLKAIMNEIRCLQFTGEVTLNILRFASNLFARGALFLHASDAIVGVGQFGFETDSSQRPMDERVRAIRIPSEEPSIFHDVIAHRETYLGALEPRHWNLELARELGGAIPKQVAVVPLLVGDQVRLLLYGDNYPADKPIDRLEQIELVMLQAGLAVEKSVLQEKLEAARKAQSDLLAGEPDWQVMESAIGAALGFESE